MHDVIAPIMQEVSTFQGTQQAHPVTISNSMSAAIKRSFGSQASSVTSCTQHSSLQIEGHPHRLGDTEKADKGTLVRAVLLPAAQTSTPAALCILVNDQRLNARQAIKPSLCSNGITRLLTERSITKHRLHDRPSQLCQKTATNPQTDECRMLTASLDVDHCQGRQVRHWHHARSPQLPSTNLQGVLKSIVAATSTLQPGVTIGSTCCLDSFGHHNLSSLWPETAGWELPLLLAGGQVHPDQHLHL